MSISLASGIPVDSSLVCPQCGVPIVVADRFCHGCGAPLGAAPSAHDLRKTVTVVFCDLVGSTTLGEGLDPEAVRSVLARYYAAARAVLERYGGRVEKFIGDAVVATFGVPVVHEDDPLRAVRAAAEMRTALADLNADLERELGVAIAVRIGVNTGEVLAGDVESGSSFATGDATNVAARLEQVAQPGEILLGPETYRLLGHCIDAAATGPLPLRGKAEPVGAWRLEAVHPDASMLARHLDTPLVGREHELATMRDAFGEAVSEPGVRLVTIIGEPGVGKSRLLLELVATVRDQARVLVGHCPPYGEGITYLPLAEIVRELDGADPRATLARAVSPDEQAEQVADLVAGAIGASERVGLTDETQWAVRRVFEALARDRPLVVCLEDLHWAEPTFLQLVEYIVGCSSGAAILVLAAARQELLEVRPDWALPRPNATLVALHPLSASEAETLLVRESGDGDLPHDLRVRIADAAGGNPLFLEQLLALRADAAAERDATVPPTIQGLLAARIDRLSPGERAVLERAAVEGRTFHRGAVAALLPSDERDVVGSHLVALARRDFVRPHPSRFTGDDGFRFVHALVRDAVYASVPKELRARLHERYALWLGERSAVKAGEPAGVVAYHLEQTVHYRKELGLMDDETRNLARHAAELLADGGETARLRGDMSAATNLLTRAAELLPTDDAVRLHLLPGLAVAFLEAGEPAKAGQVLDAALEHARAAGDDALEAQALVYKLLVDYQVDPAFDWMAGLGQAERLAETFARLGDEEGLASAWGVVGVLRLRLGRMTAAEQALAQAQEHARLAGNRFLESRMMLYALSAKATGTTPVPEALAYGDGLLEQADEMPRIGLYARIWTARLLAMQGRFDEARTRFRESEAMAQALGHRWLLSWQPLIESWVQLLARDAEGAERTLRAGKERSGFIGEGYRAGLLVRLAEALYQQDRLDEAAEVLAAAEETASSDPFARAHRNAVGAKLRARRGDAAEAERLAREAVALVEHTDDLDARGELLTDLAHVLDLAGRREEAIAALTEASALWELKQNVVSAAHAGALLDAWRIEQPLVTTKG